MTFRPGDVVGIACQIQEGPFPEEKLITVETIDGPISGFVKLENLNIEEEADNGVVRGTVVSAKDETITVKISGSFFTTALGVASVSAARLTHLAAA